MSDNPFQEPDDDRTVIRPAPGGRRPAPPAAAVPPRVAPTTRDTRTAAIPAVDPSLPPAFSISPLAAAASPLLQLLNHLRQLRQPPDLQVLRDRCLQDLRTFERLARDASIPMEVLRPAHYALCASIDDVVLNSPWGAGSDWAKQTLVANQHPAVRDPDHFVVELRQMLAAPQRYLPAIEVMYLCLSLGYMGRYRRERGAGELADVRAATHAAIAAQRAAPAPELSRRWRGVVVPYQLGSRGVPVWVAMAAAVALCGGLLLWTSANLNAASDAVQAHALAAPPIHMPKFARATAAQPVPPPPAPPEPSALDRLRAALQPDIDAHAVMLLGTPAVPVVRLIDRTMFKPGSATVATASLPVLDRVSAALGSERGTLRVIDYADNQPVRTVRFPSSFQLSTARAEAVRAIVARRIGDPARVAAEGRGDADPIASNATAEGREQNQRIEIVLQQRQD
ncbi:MAG TPA: type IVB secretion system protein IcmH/DotU [Acetobacteraceae bacterium]|nr:type IVB secretion system protein IcmH/DotU [Acetobacteraceae bacterium]